MRPHSNITLPSSIQNSVSRSKTESQGGIAAIGMELAGRASIVETRFLFNGGSSIFYVESCKNGGGSEMASGGRFTNSRKEVNVQRRRKARFHLS